MSSDPRVNAEVLAALNAKLGARVPANLVEAALEQLAGDDARPPRDVLELAACSTDERCLRACLPHLARELYDPTWTPLDTLSDVTVVLNELYMTFQTRLPGGVEAFGPIVVDVACVIEAMFWRFWLYPPTSAVNSDIVKAARMADSAVVKWTHAFNEHECWLSPVLRMVVLGKDASASASIKRTIAIPKCLRRSIGVDPDLPFSVAVHRRRLLVCGNQACAAPLLRDLGRCPAGQRCAALAAEAAGCAAAHPGRCAGCACVKYCGAACQRADWDFHKLYCQSTPTYAAWREQKK